MLENYILELVFVLVIFLIIWFLSFLNKSYESKRNAALKKTAYKHGFQFIGEPQENMQKSLSTFNLFNLGYHKNIFNLMYRNYNGKKWYLFDYRFSVNAGNQEHKSFHSVAFTKENSVALPSFSIEPKDFIKKIATTLDSKDINFISNPHFSKKYVLKGEDETLIRQIFTAKVLHFFELKENKLKIEANGTSFICYLYDQRIKPGEVMHFLGEATQSLEIFSSS